MSNMNQIASGLYKALTESDKKKPRAYDTKAEVLRLEGDTVWVKIPGGNDETPVSKTNNAKVGDNVMVRIKGGRAWLLGNETSPATDDTQANAATQLAEGAEGLAMVANKAAQSAQTAADSAWGYADLAHTAAGNAQIAADDAQRDANLAHGQAVNAVRSSTSALNQLHIVQDVAGVLNWISKHGTYKLTTDTVVDDEKWYFAKVDSYYFITADTSVNQDKTYYTAVGTVYTGEDPDMSLLYELIDGKYVRTSDTEYDDEKTYYTLEATAVSNPDAQYLNTYYELKETYQVVTPTGNPSEQGLYEYGDIKESIQQYISTHLALLDDGLYVQTNDQNNSYRLRVSGSGVDIFAADGKKVASYAASAQIGRDDNYYMKLEGNELGFYAPKDIRNGVTYENKIAWLKTGQLYINQTTVQERMDLGVPKSQQGLGQWSWKLHPTNENPNGNNLYLKWLG